VINVNKLIKPHYAQIWQTIQLIPQRKVACYGQIADLAVLPGRARLVGNALGCVPELGWRGHAVPWYRVINAQGNRTFIKHNYISTLTTILTKPCHN